MDSTFTNKDVLDVAEELIKENGETTTLEIKEELRKKGFKAFQADVSSVMDTEHHSRNLSFTENGIHRTYSEATAVAAVTSVVSSGNSGGLGLIGATSTPAKKNLTTKPSKPIIPMTVVYTRRDKLDVVNSLNPVAGDYKVFAVGFPNDCLYFSSAAYSRSMVRQAFANKTKTKYIHTRTKTVR